MVERLFKSIRKLSNKFIHSIGFVPAIMAMGFLGLVILSMELDDAGWGTAINRYFKWLTLTDPSTARSIVSTVAAGIISLTVFSFSMVMIVLNQAASQMSNRMLDNIIGDRPQKVILGFYVGTIVFSLFLLSNIKEDGQNPVPTMSVYLLLLFTLVDIFLFIYFIHYNTQSFRYEQLIQRIHDSSTTTLNNLVNDKKFVYKKVTRKSKGKEILSAESGYFQSIAVKKMINLAVTNDLVIHFTNRFGSYILKGTPLMEVHGNLNDVCLGKLLKQVDFYYGQEIDKNAYYGFFHLTEVAVKALSPGINDPGTAALTIHALTDLFSRLMIDPIANTYIDPAGKARIIISPLALEDLFEFTVLPIYDYGKNDRLVMMELKKMAELLLYIDKAKAYTEFLQQKLELFSKSAIK